MNIPKRLVRNENENSISTWITRDPSLFSSVLVTNKTKFAINFNDDGINYFTAGRYTNITNPKFINTLYKDGIENRTFRITGIKFSDYSKINYNWTQKDFLRIRGYDKWLTFAWDQANNYASFRYELNGEILINNGYGPAAVAVPTTIKTVEELSDIINGYLDATVNNPNKLKFEKINNLWGFTSTNDYEIEITKPLQILLFGQLLDYSPDLFDVFHINPYLQTAPNLNRTMIIKLNKENFITIKNETGSNYIELNQIVNNSESIINIVNNSDILRFFFQVNSNSEIGFINIDGFQFENLLSQNNNQIYNSENEFLYFDYRNMYYSNLSPNSIIIYFEEYENLKI